MNREARIKVNLTVLYSFFAVPQFSRLIHVPCYPRSVRCSTIRDAPKEPMAALIDAIDIKRKMFFELDGTPFHCLDVEVNTPTARGGQTLVRIKMRNIFLAKAWLSRCISSTATRLACNCPRTWS